jgi:hypothetical protein
MKTTLLTIVACATVATIAVADTQPEEKPWQRYSEYNMPRNIYIPGDPKVLTKENMNSGQRISFVACPILRDSDPTPLWLAEYNGETYFLRAQQNFSGLVRHPQLLHEVLVEGVISKEPRIAGGIVLSPLRLSILTELNPACNQLLPARDDYKVEFARRPPGPGSSGEDRESNNIRYTAEYRRLQAKEWTPDPGIERVAKTFIADYDFDSEMTWSYRTVMQAVTYARNINASRIEVHGTRGSALLSNGQKIFEREQIGKVRAGMVTTILHDYPLARDKIITTWSTEPEPADGVQDFANRRVAIVVKP